MGMLLFLEKIQEYLHICSMKKEVAQNFYTEDPIVNFWAYFAVETAQDECHKIAKM